MQITGPVNVISEFHGGGLGKLFKCSDQRGQLFVAKFPKDSSSASQMLIDDESRRFQRHQGQYVVKYLGPVVRIDGLRGFAMELMDGDLASLIARQGPLTPEHTLEYLSTVVSGLVELHASAPGAFHGDLKTANILHKNGIAKLADFGLARGGLGQTTMFGPHVWGTPGYMPPERHTSQQGDVYSLGAVCFALLIGREPRPGEYLQLSMPSHPEFAGLINGMLSQDPSSRPSMVQIQQQVAFLRRRSASKPAPERSSGLGTFLAAAAGVVGLVLLGGALIKSGKGAK